MLAAAATEARELDRAQCQRERVRIGNRESARQILAAGERAVQFRESRRELRAACDFRRLGRLRLPEPRAERLVQFGADQREPLKHRETLRRAGRWNERALRIEVADVLQQRCGFGMPRAVVELHERHVAARPDRVVVFTVRKLVRLQIHVDAFEVDTRFAQCDMDRLRACAGGEVKFHRCTATCEIDVPGHAAIARRHSSFACV